MLAQASIPMQALTGPVLHLGLQYLNRKFDQNRASYFTAHKIQTGSVSRSLLQTGWLSPARGWQEGLENCPLEKRQLFRNDCKLIEKANSLKIVLIIILTNSFHQY